MGQGGLWGEWGLNGIGAPREGFGGPRRGQGSIGGTEVPSGGSPKAPGFGGAFGLPQLWRARSAGGFGEALRGQGSMGGPHKVRVWGETPCWGLRGTRGPGGSEFCAALGGCRQGRGHGWGSLHHLGGFWGAPGGLGESGITWSGLRPGGAQANSSAEHPESSEPGGGWDSGSSRARTLCRVGGTPPPTCSPRGHLQCWQIFLGGTGGLW